MRLEHMRVNNIACPMGFQVSPLSFSWVVSDFGSAQQQVWAKLRVFEGERLLYDSGKRPDLDSLGAEADLPLKPRTRYTWDAAVMADNGDVAVGESWFETGKLDEPWAAQWISPKDETSAAILRKTFTLERVGEARLYLCGLGVYECYLNGEKVGDEYLAPGYHAYDLHLQAQTYDVTSYLKPGENVMELWLGEGWFKGRLGFDGGYTDLYGGRLYAIGELYVDGALVLATDGTWETVPSPVRSNSIYDGEMYDARREGLPTAGPAELAAPEGCGPLADRYSLPVVKKESFPVKELIRTPKGETVLDFGQNLTGWVEFDCDLPEGASITLTAGEILQEGCFYRDNLRTAKAEFTYISDGKRAHVRPHFTFYGFRYMRVECDYPVTADRFTAWHLRSDFDQTGFIETGHEKVNQLFSNALWGQKDNFLDVPTDCPQRDERLGWTGDAQVFSETACYNMYMPAFYRKYLWDMRAEQSLLEGSVPNVVPRIKREFIGEHGSCPWADAAVIIPWNVWLHYGNRTLLRECWPGMRAWVDCQRRRDEAAGGARLIQDGFHFADWLALDNPEPGPFGATDPLYIASAYYYRCADLTARAAEALGYPEAEEYRELADAVGAALREKYFGEDGLCLCETQTGSAIAIAFGLADEEEGDVLEARVLENNSHLNTGFVGTGLLCPALTGSGHHDTAMTLLLNEDYPSWLYSVDLGATTIWERWNSVLPDGSMNPEGMNSLNHYSYGSIEAWMYGWVCGIRPLKPGFRSAVLEPHPDRRLGHARVRLDTAVGRYESSWAYGEDGRVTYRFTVPFGAVARVRLPDGRTEILPAGNYVR